MLLMICIGSSRVSLAQMSDPNPRRAVVLEAFYALNQNYDGSCGQVTNDGKCLSNWNFLNDPLGSSAYQTVKPWYDQDIGGSYTCLASDWAIPANDNGCPNLTTLNNPPSFYSDVSDYGFSTAGGQYGTVARGGQCTFFANLLLYRSASDTQEFPSLSTMWANTDPNLQDVLEGDVLQVFNDPAQGFGNHITVVSQVYRNGSTVTAVDVVDANLLTDLFDQNGDRVEDREVIGRHQFCITTDGSCQFSGVQYIQGHYQIYKGTAYYNCPYTPGVACPPAAPTGLNAVVQ